MYSTGTATNHADLFARLRTFLTTSTGSGGAGWTELGFDGANNRVILRAPGLSGTDQIHIGLGYVADAPNDAYALTGWMFEEYQPAFSYIAQPGTSAVRYMPLWDSAIKYWFMGNGQRIIVAVKISTTYFSCYLGKFLPIAAPSEYPQPYYVGMPMTALNRWSLASASIRSFFDPSQAAQVHQPSNNWIQGGNFYQSSSESNVGTSGGYVWPYNADLGGNSNCVTRWREQRDLLGGGYNRERLVLLADDPADDVLGELDGAYAVPGFSQASEDIVQIGGLDHLVVQDNFRTNRWNYAALALE